MQCGIFKVSCIHIHVFQYFSGDDAWAGRGDDSDCGGSIGDDGDISVVVMHGVIVA